MRRTNRVTTDNRSFFKYTVILKYKNAHGEETHRELPIFYDSAQDYWTYSR